MITINVETKKKSKGVTTTKSTIACFNSLDKAKEFIQTSKNDPAVTFSGVSYDDDTEKVLLINEGVIVTHDSKEQ